VEPAELKKLVGAALGARFRRRAQHWVHRREPIAALLELQRSSYSARFYVNLAFDIGSEPVPPPHRCAFRFRAPEHPALDLEQALADDERRARLEQLVTEVWLPFLSSGLEPAGLLRLVDTVPGLITIAGRRVLSAHLGN
jgi:hypothetical protein